MASGHGGSRANAGRKAGQPKRATIDLRERYERVLAREARDIWRRNNAGKKKAERDPEPSSDDAEAAFELNVRCLLRHALKDSKASIHLDERLAGRIPYSLPEGSDPGAPVLPALLIPAGIYRAEFDDGTGALGYPRPPKASSAKGGKK